MKLNKVAKYTLGKKRRKALEKEMVLEKVLPINTCRNKDKKTLGKGVNKVKKKGKFTSYRTNNR